MEKERKAREAEEKDRQERMKKIKDQFTDPNSQWEKDKNQIQQDVLDEKNKEKEAKPAAKEPEKGSTPGNKDQVAAAKQEDAAQQVGLVQDRKPGPQDDSGDGLKATPKEVVDEKVAAEKKDEAKKENKPAEGKKQ